MTFPRFLKRTATLQSVPSRFPKCRDSFSSTKGTKMNSENFKPDWYPTVEGDEVINKVIKVRRVKTVKSIYRVLGLSAPLLAIGVILAVAQAPSAPLSTPNTQVNSAPATNIQSTVVSPTSIQQSTNITIKKPTISGNAGGDDSNND